MTFPHPMNAQKPNSELATCPNCLQPLTKHRPWCATFTTSEPLEEGDIVDHPGLGPTPMISVYLRRQAIEDGFLVDCTQEPFDTLNREAGLKFDVAMTRAVFQRYVEVPEEHQASQDIKGRYWDIVMMYRREALRQSCDSPEILFEFLCIPNGEGTLDNERPQLQHHRLVCLKAATGAGDRCEPCITFMLPDED